MCVAKDNSPVAVRFDNAAGEMQNAGVGVNACVLCRTATGHLDNKLQRASRAPLQIEIHQN